MKKILLLLLIAAGLVWFFYWYVRGINLLLDEPQNYPPPYSWATRLPAKNGSATTATPAWQTAKRMPTPRTGAAGVALNGSVYVIGGINELARTVATVEVFDVEDDSWRTVAPLPQPLHHAAAAAVGGKIYVMGGLQGLGGLPVKSFYAYDPTRDEWRQLNDLPAAFGSAAAAVLDGKIHLFGGETPSETLDQHLIFDPQRNTWESAEPLPAGRDRLAAVVQGGKIWVLGGRGGSTLYNESNVYVYNPAKRNWDDAPDLPVRRSSFAALSDGKVYVFGGEAPTNVISSVEAFNTDTTRWEILQPMPHPRFGAAYAEVGGRLFIIGGSARIGFSVSDLNEVFTLPPTGDGEATAPAGQTAPAAAPASK